MALVRTWAKRGVVVIAAIAWCKVMLPSHEYPVYEGSHAEAEAVAESPSVNVDFAPRHKGQVVRNAAVHAQAETRAEVVDRLPAGKEVWIEEGGDGNWLRVFPDEDGMEALGFVEKGTVKSER